MPSSLLVKDFNPYLGDKDDVIRKYMGLARAIAKRYRWAASQAGHVDFDDLVSEAYIGLIKAFERFDGRVSRFETYAAPVIQGEIRAFIRRRGQAVHVTDKTYRLIGRIFQCNLHDSSPSKISAELGCSELEAARALKCWKDGRVTSLDKPMTSDDGGDDSSLHDYYGRIPDMSGIHVREFLSMLRPEEYQFVLKQVAGERSNSEAVLGNVQSKLAAYMGLSESEVKQMSLELTKEKYMSLHTQGKTDAEIYAEYGMGQSQFYRKKTKWGLTTRGAKSQSPAKVKEPKSQSVQRPSEPIPVDEWKEKYLEAAQRVDDAAKQIAHLNQEIQVLKAALKFYL